MIVKRDGRTVPYDETRVRVAIELAITDNNTNNLDRNYVVNTIASNVTTWLSTMEDTEADVESIQNFIVKNMKELKLPKLAKSFTSYRNKRTRIREKKSSLMKSIGEMNNATSVSSNSKRENANIDGDTAMGTMLKFGTTTSKEYYLTSVLPEKMSTAHRDGWIHIHDLDFFGLTTTCCQIPLGKLLSKGFSTGHGHLRTPNNIITAAALSCISIQSNQNEQHGGQSIPTFDYSLAPYVAKSFIRNISKYLDMNEVAIEDIQAIETQLKRYYEEHKTLLSEKALKDVEDIIYQYIQTDFVVPGMCVLKAKTYTDRDTCRWSA